MATGTETKETEDLVCPSCGRTYPPRTNGPHFFAQHVATCKGKQETSGRIAARSGSSSSTSSEVKKQEPARASAKRPARTDPPPRPEDALEDLRAAA